jgi:hypothetical protein
MTTMFLADFYSDQMSAAALIANGYQGASCYLSHEAGKTALPSQVASYRAAQLVVSLNFEDTATNALGGYNQGVADCEFAVGLARNLGYPPGCVIFFSVDFPDVASQWAAVTAYFAGVSSAIGEYMVGCYGGLATIDLIVGGGHAHAGWQTAAWSGSTLSKYAALSQCEFGQVFDGDRVEYPVAIWGIDTVPIPPVVVVTTVTNPNGSTTTTTTTNGVVTSTATTTPPPMEDDDMQFLVEATGAQANKRGAQPGFWYVVGLTPPVKYPLSGGDPELVALKQLVPVTNQTALTCAELDAIPNA